MRLPETFRSLARPSSALKPNHPPSSLAVYTIHFTVNEIWLHWFYNEPLTLPY